MRLHRFYISEPVGQQTELAIHSPELVHQVRRVFRLKAGDSLVIFDGSGSDYECVIDGFGTESTISSDRVIRLHVATTKRSAFLPGRKVILCAAVVKKDTFEWIVEKATELGVTDIIPVMAERSEKKALNDVRLKKIAIEASEQSGRGDVPEILPVMTMNETLEFLEAKKNLEESSEDMNICAFDIVGTLFDAAEFDARDPMALFIGPEGGWSVDEIDLFHKRDIDVRCLGSQVLRAETAVIAALSQVVFRK